MADDRTRRGSPDSKRIDVNDDHELRNWAMSFNTTTEQIKDAVAKVGTSAEEVRNYLAANGFSGRPVSPRESRHSPPRT
jgi:methyl-accepting chemotaxis protein